MPAPQDEAHGATMPRPLNSATLGVEAADPSAARPWLVLWATLLVSVAAVTPQFAAPPLMPLLMTDLGIDIGQAGSLMSVFSVAGLLLALPAGLLLARFGPRRAVSTAMLWALAGCLLAATTSDFAVLLLSRVVQGVGVGLVGVAAPAVVAGAFTADRRGTPMGVWATWVPLGAIAMYVAAPPLAEAAGWQAVFAACAVASVLALVVFLAATVQAAGESAPHGSSSGAASRLGQALASRGIWLLVAVLAVYGAASSGTSTYLTTFLVGERAMDVGTASLVAGIAFVGIAGGAAAGGWISDRIGSRRRVVAGALAAMATLLAAPFVLEGAGLPIAILGLGVATGAVPAATFAAAPEMVRRAELAPGGLAAAMLGQNAGFVLGPLAFVALLPWLGWAGSAATLGVVTLAAAVASTRLRVR